MQLDLNIDELFLDGFELGDRFAIRTSIEQELSRLFQEQGVPGSVRNNGAIPRINAGDVRIESGATPAVIGSSVANAVYGGLK